MTLFPDAPESLAALSLWQPWASLMALGVKTIETRPPWAMRLRHLIGCDLAICATKSEVPEEVAVVGMPEFHEPLTMDLFGRRVMPANVRAALPRGSVLAVVRVLEVLPMVNEPEEVDFAPCIVVHGPNDVDLWHPSEEPGAEHFAGLITDVEEAAFGDYAPGRVGIITDNVRRLAEPVPCSGRQQVWNLPADVEAAVREQVAA